MVVSNLGDRRLCMMWTSDSEPQISGPRGEATRNSSCLTIPTPPVGADHPVVGISRLSRNVGFDINVMSGEN